MRSLEKSRALIVGMGGLGCPASLALASAGMKHLTIVDSDRVEISNLHRQLWYTDQEIGQPKAIVSAARIRSSFPGISVEPVVERVDRKNVIPLFGSHDIAIDGTDGVESKFLLSDAAVNTRTPVVYGGVVQLYGQAMIICSPGPCLRCLFEESELAELPTCSRGGVMGSVAGVVGAIQGLLAIEHLQGKRQGGELMIFDAGSVSLRTRLVKKAKDCSCFREREEDSRSAEAAG